MILYKYVNLSTAHLILDNPSLKFSKASSLNDPFELTGLHYGEAPHQQIDPDKFIPTSLSYGILSLTRNPLNPLMWAHYGNGEKAEGNRGIQLDQGNGSHAGIAFGIDIDEAGLNTPGSNVIPAKYGSIIYTATKPSHPFEQSENMAVYEGLLYNFQPNLLEALQRTFLYKSSHWSYEEEVRVIRNVLKQNNEIQPMEKSCFKEAVIGYRNSFNKDYLISLKEKIEKSFPCCKIFTCGINESEWTFKKIPIDDAIRRIE